MGKYYSDLNCEEYQFRWQTWFSMRGKSLGHAAALSSRKSISVWRAMRRRAIAGQAPSLLDYPDFGRKPYRFLFDRSAKIIKKAVRSGQTHEAMVRRGIFNALRHHQAFRQFCEKRTMRRRSYR
jgi:hypothetical protein